MAVGDDAAAMGFPLVAGTAARRDGYTEINRTRDFVAQARTWAAATFSTAAGVAAAIAGKADAYHTHDDRYTPSTDLVANFYSKADINYINGGSHPSIVVRSDGPSDAAYGRSPTGSGWYTVQMNSAKQFMRSTSSRRYKSAEKPFSVDPALILSMVPTTYHRKGQKRGTRELGLIAEDVAALGVPHLVAWEADEDGNERPEGVRYDQVLSVMLLHVCRDQQRQLDELRAALEARA